MTGDGKPPYKALVRLLSDDPADPLFWRGVQLGVVQACAVMCPVGALILHGWGAVPQVAGVAFGWAGWALRGFALRVPGTPARTRSGATS